MLNNDLLFLFPKASKSEDFSTEILNSTFDDPLENLLNEFSDIVEIEDGFEVEVEDNFDIESDEANRCLEASTGSENTKDKIELLKTLQQKTKFLLREIKIYTS